nr:hypothetical protein [Tanacetum cinerariifolium]
MHAAMGTNVLNRKYVNFPMDRHGIEQDWDERYEELKADLINTNQYRVTWDDRLKMFFGTFSNDTAHYCMLLYNQVRLALNSGDFKRYGAGATHPTRPSGKVPGSGTVPSGSSVTSPPTSSLDTSLQQIMQMLQAVINKLDTPPTRPSVPGSGTVPHGSCVTSPPTSSSSDTSLQQIMQMLQAMNNRSARHKTSAEFAGYLTKEESEELFQLQMCFPNKDIEIVPLTYNVISFQKFPENNFEVLKLLENSVEVLKILENKLESMKILENKLESLKLQENQPVDGLVPLSIKKFTSERVFERLLKSKDNNFNN